MMMVMMMMITIIAVCALGARRLLFWPEFSFRIGMSDGGSTRFRFAGIGLGASDFSYSTAVYMFGFGAGRHITCRCVPGF